MQIKCRDVFAIIRSLLLLVQKGDYVKFNKTVVAKNGNDLITDDIGFPYIFKYSNESIALKTSSHLEGHVVKVSKLIQYVSYTTTSSGAMKLSTFTQVLFK